ARSPRVSPRQVLLWLADAAQRGVDLTPAVLSGLVILRRRRFVLLLGLDLEVHLFTEYRDGAVCLDADSHLLPHDREHGDLDVVADHDALVRLAREYKHSASCFPRLRSGQRD